MKSLGLSSFVQGKMRRSELNFLLVKTVKFFLGLVEDNPVAVWLVEQQVQINVEPTPLAGILQGEVGGG